MESLNKIIVTDIFEIFTIPFPKGRTVNIENRYCYGLSLCTGGQLTYTQNGKQFISDSAHAIILPKGQNYTIHGDKAGNFPLINFSCQNFLCEEIIALPICDLPVYLAEYQQMQDLFLFERNSLKVMSIFYNMLHRLSSAEIFESDILAPAIKYLENNFSNPDLNNKTLANECFISEVYFRKLFREKFGITPKQYIIDTRISRAKQLLCDGILKINAVSEKCGFSNPYHFCRVFKSHTGLTPSEYIKKNRIYKI